MAGITMLAPFRNDSPLTEFARNEFAFLADLKVVGTNSGLAQVSLYHHIEQNIGSTIEKAMEIEAAGGCDALILGCFGDPGLAAVRQVTSMPVVGTGEAALAVASLLGDRIGVIVPQADMVRVTERMIHAYRFSGRVIKVCSAEEMVPETIMSRPDESIKKMADTCLDLIRTQDVDVVIFGCIGFSWMVKAIRERIAAEGLQTPLLEPGITVYHAAKMVAALGLNQDRGHLGVR